MKVILALFVLVAAASAQNFLGARPQPPHIVFNATDFWLGANAGLGIVSNSAVLACGGMFIPTLQDLSIELQALQSFAFGYALEHIDTLVATLQTFKGDCQPVYDIYSAYFGEAVTAFQNDQGEFFRNVVANLKHDKADTLLKAAQVALLISENKDYEAGRAFTPLAQKAIKNYLH